MLVRQLLGLSHWLHYPCTCIHVHDFITSVYIISVELYELLLSSAPSAAPNSPRITNVTTSTITIQWNAVECIHRNGDITGYSVRYGDGNPRQTNDIKMEHLIIIRLNHSTTYTIQVAAVNSVGTGVYSEQLSISTTGIKYQGYIYSQ